MRALVFFTTHIQDQVEILGGHGDKRADELDKLNDLLLPLVKGWSSERGYEQLAIALQIIGGSGYVQDYPFEQYVRDQKIDSLYEGTTHIQAQDLIFRKIFRDGGATLQSLMKRVQETVETEAGGEQLADERKALVKALGEMQGLFGALMAKTKESPYHVGLQGNRVLLALADLVVGWLLVKHAAIAVDALPKAKAADKNFYQGKIASAKWWTRNVLPGLALTRKLVEASDLSALEVDEAYF
jgi:alkylation response protein AidB-like acyl-CoA dehydrogenase